MDPDQVIFAKFAHLADKVTGEHYFGLRDAGTVLTGFEEAGFACIGVDGYIERDGGHTEPLEWIYDGSPEDNPAPDWPTFKRTTNARARQHLAAIEQDGAMGCSFVMINESEWRSAE